MRTVAIIGSGMTRFGKHHDKSVIDLMSEAVLEALALSKVDRIDGLIVGTMSPEHYENRIGIANILAGHLGVEGAIVMRAENTSGSGGSALYTGWLTVACGLADIVVVVGGEKMTHLSTEENAAIIAGLVHEYERRTGVTLPSYAALVARYYLYKYNVPREALAYVAIKNHKNGSLNPKAHFQKEITPEDYFKSKMVADPLRVMDYAPISDGAAAVVLAPLDIASSYTSKPIVIKSIVGATDTLVLHEREDLLHLEAVRTSTQRALKEAKLTLNDVDLLEVHDMATILELIELESMGFFPRGGSWQAVIEGYTQLDGELPVNSSGGLKSKGHPIGATGVSQAHEVFLQMRREAERRQVRKDVRVALSMSMGGFGNNAYTVVYEVGW
uniref:Thiolase family protein n=1 Tax=Fervidicoccus fontis TaxID=683846 RepID=A0A7J3ZKE6_9CREN